MSGLASLTAQYTDSENEDDASPSYKKPDVLGRDMQRVLEAPPVAQLKVRNLHNRVEITPNGSTGPLVAYDGHDSDGDDVEVDIEPKIESIEPDDEEYNSVDMDVESQNSQASDEPRIAFRAGSPRSFHRELLGTGPPVQLPPEPAGKCSDELQAMIVDYCNKTDRGMDLVGSIQRKKAFRNPSIYEKLLLHCDIDELGSNFPSEIFDPHSFKKEDFYEELGRKQNELMEKEKRRKSDGPAAGATGPATAKKSKWDQGGQSGGPAPKNVAAPGLVSIPTGTKVAISGIGSLPKPKNPVTHVGTSAASRR